MASTLTVDNIQGATATGNVHIPGHVVQVVTADIGGTAVTTTSASFVTSGKSATITPKHSNSKIIIQVHLGDTATTNSHAGIGVALYRGSSKITDFTSRHAYTEAGTASLAINGLSPVWFDSPSTTSATTYTIYINNGSAGTATLFRDNTDGCIVLTEIAQ